MSLFRIKLPQSTLDLLVLRTLAFGSAHVWDISQRILRVSGDVLQIEPGELYSALDRLKRRGWIGANWAIQERNHRVLYYSVTPAGSRHLQTSASNWQAQLGAAARIVQII